jgi:hypothetical protein
VGLDVRDDIAQAMVMAEVTVYTAEAGHAHNTHLAATVGIPQKRFF